jgi:hypothetical protein
MAISDGEYVGPGQGSVHVDAHGPEPNVAGECAVGLPAVFLPPA